MMTSGIGVNFRFLGWSNMFRLGELLLGIVLLTATAAVFWFQFRKLRSPAPGWWATDAAQTMTMLVVLMIGVLAFAFILKALIPS
jgi:hypothetical protein